MGTLTQSGIATWLTLSSVRGIVGAAIKQRHRTLPDGSAAMRDLLRVVAWQQPDVPTLWISDGKAAILNRPSLYFCTSILHTSFWKHQTGSSEVICSFVCFAFRIYIVCGFEEEDSLENLRILSCFVLKSVLFNVLCVYDLFQNAGSQLCFRFF